MILNAWGWCTETTQRDGTGRKEAGGFRMGNTYIPVADSCWCMEKPIQYCKVKTIIIIIIKLNLKKRKGRGTRDQIANIYRIIDKAREFQKNIYFCFIGYAKTFDCVDHNKLWKILQENWNCLTCLLSNLYAGQEASARTGHGTTDWFEIGKGICQGCIFLPAILIPACVSSSPVFLMMYSA